MLFAMTRFILMHLKKRARQSASLEISGSQPFLIRQRLPDGYHSNARRLPLLIQRNTHAHKEAAVILKFSQRKHQRYTA